MTINFEQDQQDAMKKTDNIQSLADQVERLEGLQSRIEKSETNLKDLKKEMEIPETLKDMGVQPGDEVKLAPLAQEDPSTGGNPLEMTEEKFQELIANCISGKY